MSTTSHRQSGMLSALSLLIFRRGSSDNAANTLGGNCATANAAGALSTGDVVYYNSSAQVAKSTTGTNYATFAGVVIGGRLLGHDKTIYGTGVAVASAANHYVYVQQSGIVRVTAGAAITIGQTVIPDTGTAGRVIAGTTAGQIIGTALTAATANGDEISVYLDHR